MAAQPNNFPEIEAYQDYYAEASFFEAKLEQPVQEAIEPQGVIVLPKTGGYDYKKIDKPNAIKGLISYQSGYTQVAGHPSTKADGFTTLATSVLEGLNVLDVLTADRVVGQVSTVHPYNNHGHVPSVTFLGTRFDNLRISGQPVEVEHNLSILGAKPADDVSYFKDAGVLNRISHLFSNINREPNLPAWAANAYQWDAEQVQQRGEMSCSLVSGVDGVRGGTTFGHVIDLPHFGRIFLGELKVTRETTKYLPEVPNLEDYKYRFQLTMIRLELGCLAHGQVKVSMMDTNGQGGGTHKP